jgi:hypothetical protein
MPTFIRRIRRSLRPSRNTLSRAAANHPNQSSHDQPGSLGYDEPAPDHDGRDSPELPVIGDRGPPTANRYTDADMFWNSIMDEADGIEKDWVLVGRPRRSPSKVNSSQLQDIGEADTSDYGESRMASENIKQQDGETAASKVAAARKRRQDSFKRLERNISYGRERADNDVKVMFYTTPDYDKPPANSPQPPRPSEPLSPGTRAWDNFMDFPSNNSAETHSTASAQSSGFVESSTAPSAPLNAIQEEKELPAIPVLHHKSSPSSSQTSLDSSIMMTWNMCLNDILRNEAVDLAMKQAVIERVKDSITTNGTGEVEHFRVSIREAGLVPNFSYPIVGGEFYDRVAAVEAPPLPITNGIHKDAEREQGKGEPEHVHLHNFAFGLKQPNGFLTPSLAPTPTPTPSASPFPSSSSENSHNDTLYRRSSPPSSEKVNIRINKLLTEVLSPSELNLCTSALSTPAITPTPQCKTPSPTPQSSLPTSTRLTQSLHSLLHHLQDRVLYFEDNLLPPLGAALETKTFTIDVMSVEIQNLGDQIREMKATVDFSTRILAHCWLREYEVWRTLEGIRRERRLRRRLWWGRLMGWKWSRGKEDGDGDVFSPVTKMDGKLKNGEVDAMVLMAEQNVQILREDVDDMVERIEGLKRKFVAYPVVEREEGSWRDV